MHAVLREGVEALERPVDCENRVIAAEIPDQTLLIRLHRLVDADPNGSGRVKVTPIDEYLVAAADVVARRTRGRRQQRKAAQQQANNEPYGTNTHWVPPNRNEYSFIP